MPSGRYTRPARDSRRPRNDPSSQVTAAAIAPLQSPPHPSFSICRLHYWIEIWRRKEMLADLDILSNNVFDTDDMEDVIARLEAAASAAEAAKAY